MVLALLMSLLIEAEPPQALKDLVTQARVAATSDETNGGVSRELVSRAEAINKFGEQAIPLVMPLLQHPSSGVRNFFGYVVAELPGLTPRELAPLIAAYRGGNNWVARAIGHIDSPASRKFLVESFLAKPERYSGLGNALIELGERGATALVGPLKGQAAVEPLFPHAACSVFREIGEPAGKATADLLSILKDENVPMANRAGALTLLACVPSLSDSLRSSVDSTVRSNRALREDQTVARLQRQMATPDGITNSIGRIADDPEELGYLRLAGQSARKAEPAVLKLLEHQSAGIRLAAIEVLGALGGEASLAPLEELLRDPRDWRAPCAAARALAQLKARERKEAVRSAERVAWLPTTAKCLREASSSLQSGRPLEPNRSGWQLVGEKQLAPTPLVRRGPGELDERALEKLSVTGAIRSWTPQGEFITSETATPRVALAIDGGILAGTDRGEWGGELVLLSPDAGQRLLLEENVTGIHRLGGQIVVVTGLAHLSSSEGALYRVQAGPDGKLKASEWRILPGAPERSVVLPNGRLFISCSGADIVIDEAGTISLATEALVH